jgi:hypothetical protein
MQCRLWEDRASSRVFILAKKEKISPEDDL